MAQQAQASVEVLISILSFISWMIEQSIFLYHSAQEVHRIIGQTE